MFGSLVCRSSSTTTPLLTVRPARSASATSGMTPTPAMMRSHASLVPSPRGCAGGEDQFVVCERLAVCEAKLAPLRVDRLDSGVEAKLDVVGRVLIFRLQRDPLRRRFAGQVILREVRFVVRQSFFARDERDAAGEAVAAELVGGEGAGGAGAQNDDVLWSGVFGCSVARLRGAWVVLLSNRATARLRNRRHSYDVTFTCNRERPQRPHRRRSDGHARPQIETGVMPRAAHRLSHQYSFGQWSVPVRAVRVERKVFVAAAREQHVVVADFSGDHSAVREFIHANLHAASL